MAESTVSKRQNSEPTPSSKNGSEPPSSAEKKPKYAEGDGSEPTPSSKNGSEPPSSAAKYAEGDGSNIQKLTSCVNQWSLTPFDEGYAEFFYRELPGNGDIDEILPDGASKEQRPDFVEIWVNYDRQMYISDGFDCYDYPCGSFATSIIPLTKPSTRVSELMMELANLAIKEYNEKECNVFKYKVLKIEKANYQLTSYFQYYMTVKVLNITLGSLIETFLILAAKGLKDDFKQVFSCQPKVKIVQDDYPTTLDDAAHHD